MRLELNRRASFAYYQTEQNGVLLDQLAACGFYCCQTGLINDTTAMFKCAFCLGIITSDRIDSNTSNWNTVWQLHRALYSLCPFVIGMQVGNVPISPSDTSCSTPVQCTESNRPPDAVHQPLWCTQNGREFHLTPDYSLALPPPSGRSLQAIAFAKSDAATRSSSWSSCESLSLESCPPVSPSRARQACREEAEDAASIRNLPRVSDFKNRLSQLRCDEDIDAFDSCWCWNRRLTAWELASAGFLPVNNGIDRVECYCCDLELRLDWTELASPCDAWVQHARWSPRCAHVLGKRGVEFVLAVQARMPAFVGVPLPQAMAQQPRTGLFNRSSSTSSMPSAVSHLRLRQSTGTVTPLEIRSRAELPSVINLSRLLGNPSRSESTVAMEMRLRLVGDDYPEAGAGTASLLEAAWRQRDLMQLESLDRPEQLLQLAMARLAAAAAASQLSQPAASDSCRLCSNRLACVAYLPCGHVACCRLCSKGDSARICPVCRLGVCTRMLVTAW
ncbi:hypothetical protein BOX15_Mlig021418g1 [Macrostomum lignano]|uniref:RING-type domain-containing protein n=1 Tax=Macrostomum lignano TaxID=282301 RepID=A0A267EVU1_9PLAT|nr:hypothetical protein BOX15_Mlig021418g1 [Macrostomum lignano]